MCTFPPQEWLYLASRSRQAASTEADVILKKGISPDACFESTRMLRLARGTKHPPPSSDMNTGKESPAAALCGSAEASDLPSDAGSENETFVEYPNVYPGDKVGPSFDAASFETRPVHHRQECCWNLHLVKLASNATAEEARHRVATRARKQLGASSAGRIHRRATRAASTHDREQVRPSHACVLPWT